MKRARFTEKQIIAVLKEHEARAKTADLARKHGISEATFYNKAKYGGMNVSEASRQRAGRAHLNAVMGLSERRACLIVGADRKMLRYRSRRLPDTELRGRLRELANERRRFGYRRPSGLASAPIRHLPNCRPP
jgi:putative transposase